MFFKDLVVKSIFVPFVVLILSSCGNLITHNGSNDKIQHEKKSENVITLVADQVSDDLILAVGSSNYSYILNKSGERLWNWKFDENLGNDLKLLPTAHVLAMFNNEESPIKFGGGYSGLTQIIDFNDSITWEFEYATKDYLTHHESIFLPNGNLLMLSWERVTQEVAKMHGVNMDGDIFPEKIIEVDTTTKNYLAMEKLGSYYSGL